MDSWFTYFKQGISRKLPQDRIATQGGSVGLKANLKNVWPFVARHWGKGVVGILLIVFTSLLGLPQPLIVRYLTNDVILGNQLHLLLGAILLLAGITVIEILSKLWQQFYCTRFEQLVIMDIQRGLFDRVLHLPKSFFDKNQTGYLMSRVSSDVQGLHWLFSGTVVQIITNLVRFVAGAVALLYLEWRLGLGVLLLVPGVILCVYWFSGKLHILSHQTMEQQANVSSSMEESLSAASLIKSFSSEDRAVERLSSRLKSVFRMSLEQDTVNSVAGTMVNLLPGIARGVVLALGAYLIITGHWSLGSLLAFQMYLGYVFSPAEFLATANLQLQEARAALDRVSALFDVVPEESVGTGVTVERLKGDIEFKNVSFAYDSREPILEDVSFHVQPGEHVAIVGPSGVGKTTLVSLILRFYKPRSGEIYFDGLPAGEYEVASLRRRIGYVSQSTLLLSGTILENLRYGNPDASDEQVVGAAKAADIHEFICSLSKGYDSEIGERGVNLSEGQRQRLSIARALVKDPDILILDEPTSALDSQTEGVIFNSLPSRVQGKTLFIIAHQLSTIQKSDRVLKLNESRLVAIDTHDSIWGR